MLFVMMIVCLLLASLSLPAIASENTTTPVWVPLSKPLSVEGKGTIELKTIYSVPSKDGQVVSFTLDFMNKSNEVIDFNRYWLRIQTKSGAKYPINLIDSGNSKVYPNQKQTFIFYHLYTVKLSEIQLRFIKWDFTISSYERELALIPINSSSIPLLGKSIEKVVGQTNNQLLAKIEQGAIQQEDSRTSVFYNLVFKLRIPTL